MTNTSATGGYLLPEGAAGTPAEWLDDQAFEDFLHDVIAGITGLAADAVRPRWQEEPPTLPPRGTDWVAFGIVDRRPDATAAEVHLSDSDGQRDVVGRYEDADMLCSFYGPHANGYGTQLREGLQVGQNREVLDAAQVKIKRIAGPAPVPSLVKQKWLYRADLTVTLRRQLLRVYPVLDLVKAAGTITTDMPPATTPFATPEPTP